MKAAIMVRSSGFTVIETMIVLVISMSMFVGAATMISGKQNSAGFNQASRSIQVQVQQVINEVGSGYYSSDGKLSCKAGSSDGYEFAVVPLGDQQGRSQECLFLGKVIQFGVPPDPSGDSDMQSMNVYTVIGLASGVGGDGLVKLNTANARVLARSDADVAMSTIPDKKFDHRIQQYGMTVSEVYMNTPTPPDRVVSVGFITNLSDMGAGDGSQRTDVVALPSVKPGDTSRQAATAINTDLRNPLLGINPKESTKICFNSGGTDESVLMLIGGSGRQGTVDMKRFSKKDCAV